MVRIGNLWGSSASHGNPVPPTSTPAVHVPVLPATPARKTKLLGPLREPHISRRFAELMVHHGSTAYTDHGAVAKMLQHLRCLAAQGGEHAAAFKTASQALAGGMDLWYRQSTELGIRLFASVYTAGLSLCPGVRQLACWHLGKHVLQRLHREGQALILNGLPAHATLTQIIREPAGTYTLKIFNSGMGIAHHTARPDAGPSKYQSVFEVRNSPTAQLSARQIGRMLAMRDVFSTFSDQAVANRVCHLYAWASAQGEVHNPPTGPVQAVQKGNTCSYKCVLAYLRNTLSDAAFTHCMAQLHTHAARTLQRRRPQARLTQTLQIQAQRARHKADAAAYRAHWVAQVRHAPWFVQTTNRAGLRHAVRQAARRTGHPAFALIHCPDTRQLALYTAQPGQEAHPTRIDVVSQNDTPRLHIAAPAATAGTYKTLQEVYDQACQHCAPIDARTGVPPATTPQDVAVAWQAQGAAFRRHGYLGPCSSIHVHHLLNKHTQRRAGAFVLRYDAGQQAFVATAQLPTRAGALPRRHVLTFDLDPYTKRAYARGTDTAFPSFAAMFAHAQSKLCLGPTRWTPVSQ